MRTAALLLFAVLAACGGGGDSTHFDVVPEVEPNDDTDTAQPISIRAALGARIDGVVGPGLFPGDGFDVFEVGVADSCVVEFRVVGDNAPAIPGTGGNSLGLWVSGGNPSPISVGGFHEFIAQVDATAGVPLFVEISIGGDSPYVRDYSLYLSCR